MADAIFNFIVKGNLILNILFIKMIILNTSSIAKLKIMSGDDEGGI